MNADHIMVDLETMDNSPTSAIISIGAVVFFGPNSGKEFYTAVDLDSSVAAGLTVSADTILWWQKQGEDARKVLTDPSKKGLEEALLLFAKFVSLTNDPRVWGNGASFDNAILQTAYRAVDRPLPWKFWNDRCYRTVAARIPTKRKQGGVYHNALDDAKSQAEHLVAGAPEAIV